jgi:hypothetical protein
MKQRESSERSFIRNVEILLNIRKNNISSETLSNFVKSIYRVEGLVSSQVPEGYTVATGKVSLVRQVKGEEPD